MKEIFHGKSYPSGENVLKEKDNIYTTFDDICKIMSNPPTINKIWNESFIEICSEALFYILKILRKTQSNGQISNEQNILGLIEVEKVQTSFKPILDIYFAKRNTRIKFKSITSMVKKQPFFSSLLILNNCCSYITDFKFPSLFLFGECIVLMELILHYPLSFKFNIKLLTDLLKCLDDEIPTLLMTSFNNENEKLKGLTSSKRIRPILELMKTALLNYEKIEKKQFNV